MGKAIVTIRVMPDSPDTDMDGLRERALQEIEKFAGKGDTKVKIEPVAFGLKSLNIIFIMDESKGSTEDLENAIAAFDDVNSVEVTDVRRAIG